MKNLILTQLLLLITCLSTFGQTYSSIIDDIEITAFIHNQAKGKYNQKINNWKLEEVYQPDSVLKKLGSWKTLTPSEKRNYSFNYGEAPLLADFLTRADFEFIKEQISGLKVKEWQTVKEFQKTKNSEHNKDEYYIYSVPLFSKDRNYALMKTELYCGNLCGWSCVELFKKIENGQWENKGCFSKKVYY
ncbi:hypothetical protein HUW51_16340 [Adhaeribacter swui]|uniref:GLPGLI family protein n=1 Tax=Adhaeribacter swui TaxID=2086471 RepID=A0A7G7GAM9_9BACT|nr:hypothetical protein [Adhaeribacter swui]QNF34213.1 hypothetical protein HUW51_16340 [Adhaeribacter swui]